MQVANIYPDRITVTHQRPRSYMALIDSWLRHSHPDPAYIQNQKSLANLCKPKKSIELSPAASRSLRDSINAMVMLSKPRTILRKGKSPIYNYRASFITLKLPSPQQETDVEIKKCLNLFFTDLRRVYQVENYVWRAELQKNGNIHFHVVIDRYIRWQVLRNYWLKALRHTSQVKRYQAKFSKMSFQEYANYRQDQHKEFSKEPIPHQNLVDAYAQGKRSKWLTPNCVDVRSVYNPNQAAAYVAKYLSKSSKAEVSQDRIENFGKVWGRSTSLSRLKFRFPLVYDSVSFFIRELEQAGAIFTKVYDWCTVHYFRFADMPRHCYTRIFRNIRDVGITFAYPFNST